MADSQNKGIFPSQAVSFSEKESKQYGKKIGDAIEHEWFKADSGTPRYFMQRQEFHKRRLYARGEQPVQKYKDELAINGDLSYLNLDWKPVPIIPKFVDIVVNGIQERTYDIKAYAQDPTSVQRKSDHVKAIMRDMKNREMLNAIQEQLGMNLFKTDPNKLPENDEELALRVQLDEKDEIEIASEVAIQNVLDHNKYDLIKKRLDYDNAVLGMSASRHTFNLAGGIVTKYVDPMIVVYSYTDDPYFRDLYYCGEVRRISLNELKKEFPKLSSEDIEKIENSGHGQMVYSRNRDNAESSDANEVYVLYFEYKTFRDQVFKVKKTASGAEKVIEKDDTWNAESNENFEVIRRSIEVVMEGAKIIGADIMLDWKVAENITRPKSNTTKANLSYTLCTPRVYNGKIESLVSRMIPFGDTIQIAHLKLQQVVAKTIPNGIYLDADGLTQIDLGNGTAYNPQEALNMYFQTGSVVGRSMTQDGEFNHARIPIQELQSDDGGRKIAALINYYNSQLQMIRDVTGLNEARDGSQPDKDALVGVQKLAAANSNTATRHVVDAGLYQTQCIAEGVSLRISDALEYGHTTDAFITSIGKYNVSTLESIKDLHLHDMGIYIELAPDEEEKMALEGLINLALNRDQIDLEDAIDVRAIKNLKLANQLLKLRRRKREERKQAQEMQKIQAQGQVNAQAAEAKAQAELRKEQGMSAIRSKEKQMEMMLELQAEKSRSEIEKGLKHYQFQLDKQLKELELQVIDGKERFKEDRKDQRTKIQATQQSEMIEQRKGNSGPKNFENSEEDMLGDMQMM